MKRTAVSLRAVLSLAVLSTLVPTTLVPTTVSRAASKTKPARQNAFRTGRTLVIAHSGGDALFPENTVLAYQRSTALGGDVIDIDVQLISDGTLVALHDATVNRTTNGTGAVRSKTYAQLQQLDAGYRFSKNGTFPFRGKGITIPRVLDVVSMFPKSLVTLDLKDQRVEVVKPVCDLVLASGRIETIYIGVDTDEQVLEFRRRCPLLHTSGTSAERQALRAARAAGDTKFPTRQLVSQPPYIGDDGAKRVTAESLAFSHALNIAVLTWVVDDPAAMQELVNLGVDGIYTRRPDLLVKIVRSTSQRKNSK